MHKQFLIQKTEDAQDLPLPSYMTQAAAAMDLYANIKNKLCIKPMQRLAVPCGFRLALPLGYEAQIRPRSGIALKHGITMLNAPGTIDADYRGEVHVLLINFGEAEYIINRGDRIAQMLIAKVEQTNFKQANTLPSSARGDGGFGSTGK